MELPEEHQRLLKNVWSLWDHGGNAVKTEGFLSVLILGATIFQPALKLRVFSVSVVKKNKKGMGRVKHFLNVNFDLYHEQPSHPLHEKNI